MSNLRASIDIGSNSILLLVVDVDNNFNVVANESTVTGLGKGLDQTGTFSEDSILDSMNALHKYAEICKKLGVDKKNIIATATEASRVAKNSKIFYEKVYIDTGITVTLITGQAEAYYSTAGILFNTKFDREIIHVMDIGGASTELIKVDVTTRNILESFSMPIGAVRITNWLEQNIYESKLAQVYNDFHEKLKLVSTDKLQCVAGTMTSIANMQLKNKEYKELEVHGHCFSSEEVFKMYEVYKNIEPVEILKTFPFLGKRANTIIGGMLVATNIFKWLNVQNVQISTYGLRYGTIIEGSIKDEFIFRK